jgi:hypothetical protein
MARKVDGHVLPTPEEGVRREDCLKPCLSIDAVNAAEKVAIALSTVVLTGLTRDIVLQRETGAEFRAGPSKVTVGVEFARQRRRSAPTPSSLR